MSSENNSFAIFCNWDYANESLLDNYCLLICFQYLKWNVFICTLVLVRPLLRTLQGWNHPEQTAKQKNLNTEAAFNVPFFGQYQLYRWTGTHAQEGKGRVSLSWPLEMLWWMPGNRPLIGYWLKSSGVRECTACYACVKPGRQKSCSTV